MNPSNPDDDLPRDAHLLAALRHAPDREATPPHEVSALILASAQAAVRHAAEPMPRATTWRQRLDAWLGGARAPWPAAFGTLALGAIVGLMWSSIAPPSPVPFETAPVAPSAASVDENNKTLKETAATTAVAARSDASAPPAASTDVPAAKKTKPAPPAQVTARLERDRLDPAASAPAPMLAQAPAAAAAPAKAEVVGGVAVAPEQKVEERRRVVPEARDAGASMRAAAPASASGLADRLAPTAPAALAKAANAAAFDPTARIDALLARLADRAAWTAGAAAHAHGAAQRDWWSELRAATQGRWQRGAAAANPATPWLSLSIDGRSVATLGIADGMLTLREGDALWRAPITEAQQRDWQERVSRW